MSGLERQQIADRVAQEFQDGWIVNLGVGMPTMCSNTPITADICSRSWTSVSTGNP